MNPLDRAAADLVRLAEVLDVGTRDRPRRVSRLDLTLERLRTWRDDRVPNLSDDSPRGGSSSPTDVANRLEDRAVHRAAENDARALACAVSTLLDIALRYTVPIDHSGLPKGPAGCRSCGRQRRAADGTLIPGHFREVAARYRGRGLCTFCGNFYAATRQYPPLDIVDVYHRQGPNAAGRALAKHRRSRA